MQALLIQRSCITIVSVIDITPDMRLGVKYGAKYGTTIKVQRGERFIIYSQHQWLRIREHVPRMMIKDFALKLSDKKYIRNKIFAENGVTYISFSKTYENREGKLVDSYINFNPDEWQCFLDTLREMDMLFPPKKIKACPDCAKNITVAPIDAQGRTQETRLSASAKQAVEDNNEVAYNQRMHKCTYCGDYDVDQDYEDCHCHKYNCQDCEKQNFCKTCRRLLIKEL